MSAKPRTKKRTRGKKTRKRSSPQRSVDKAYAEELLGYYRDMLLIRRFEEKAGQMYGMGLIGGFCHLYIGQEAVVVGAQAAIEEHDAVITLYRDHGHMLVCGTDPRRVMAELTGRAAGCSSGKGGSMHMFNREQNFYGGHGIVGASTTLGTGIAFANQYLSNDEVTLAYFGDGSANQGQVHESYNMAALWELPIVYIIENNQYAMGTAVTRSTVQPQFYKRGEAFGLPGTDVDGMDVLAVRDAVGLAVEHARSVYGPYILEAMTYRYRGHSMSDPAKYRSREEVNKVRKERDPIDGLRGLLLGDGVATEENLKEIDKEVKSLVAEAAEYAQESPEPEPAELYSDILLELDAAE